MISNFQIFGTSNDENDSQRRQSSIGLLSNLSNTNSSSALFQPFDNSSLKAFKADSDINRKDSLKESKKERIFSNNEIQAGGLSIILSDSEEAAECKRCVHFNVGEKSQAEIQNSNLDCLCIKDDANVDEHNESSGTVNLKSWR